MQTLPDYTVEEGENIFKIIADWRVAAKKRFCVLVNKASLWV